jgi:hypothetical protein
MDKFTEKQKAGKPVKVEEPEDLDGIKPAEVLAGAFLYAGIAVLFYLGGFPVFDKINSFDFSSQSVGVYRLASGVANLIAASLALGVVSTSIISIGQFYLFVQLLIGIQKGEIDPNKEQSKDVSEAIAKAKTGKYQKMFSYMTGDVNAGGAMGNKPVENKALKLLNDKIKR